MPLRDHFHPPISRTFAWKGFHGTWPGMLVGRVRGLLPPGYPVVLGQPLPALPLWYAPEQAVTLDLEGSYEDTCQLLGIG